MLFVNFSADSVLVEISVTIYVKVVCLPCPLSDHGMAWPTCLPHVVVDTRESLLGDKMSDKDKFYTGSQ